MGTHMSHFFSALTFAALVFAGPTMIGAVAAAGPYDGQWNGHMEFSVHKGGGCATSDFPVTVADNKISGEVKGLRSTYQLAGTVAKDGNFKGTIGKARVNGKFTADKFEGLFTGAEASCGAGHLTFDRAK
jgi:hypothetical protein